MKEYITYNQKCPIKVKLPNSDDELLLAEVKKIEDSEENKVMFHLRLKNSEKFNVFTENILKFYIKNYLKTELKLFCIDKEVDIKFT